MEPVAADTRLKVSSRPEQGIALLISYNVQLEKGQGGKALKHVTRCDSPVPSLPPSTYTAAEWPRDDRASLETDRPPRSICMIYWTRVEGGTWIRR